MPIYEYQASGKRRCEGCAEPFEVVQPMGADPLPRCEKCGASIRRLLSTPAIHGAAAHRLSNKSLAEQGFTKYVKAGDGHYEKAAGKGPNTIKR